MSALNKNAISVTMRDRAKRTKILDHKDYKRQVANIFKNYKFIKETQIGHLVRKCYLVNGEK